MHWNKIKKEYCNWEPIWEFLGKLLNSKVFLQNSRYNGATFVVVVRRLFNAKLKFFGKKKKSNFFIIFSIETGFSIRKIFITVSVTILLIFIYSFKVPFSWILLLLLVVFKWWLDINFADTSFYGTDILDLSYSVKICSNRYCNSR